MSDFIRDHKRHFHFNDFIKTALAEDLGEGDHTALCTIPPGSRASMQLMIKERGILGGVEAAEKIIRYIDLKSVFRQQIKDGTEVRPGQIAFTVIGNARRLLSAERLVLNVMQRMSGIATTTAD